MTREEYMQDLGSRLDFIEEGQRQAVLDFYGEMLDDRMEDGMDEASAVAAMESAEEIAARLRQDPSAFRPQEVPAPEMTDEAMKFSSLTGQIMKNLDRMEQERIELRLPTREEYFGERWTRMEKAVREAEKKQESQAPEAAPEMPDGEKKPEEAPAASDEEKRPEASERSASWGDVAGKAAGMVEDILQMAGKAVEEAEEKLQDEAKQRGGTEETVEGYTRRTFVCDADALRAVRLKVKEMPIVITGCGGREAELVYYSSEDEPYEARLERGVLTLEAEHLNQHGGRLSFSMLGGVLRFGWRKPSPTVELHLPADALVDLSARTGNASIRAEGMHALCNVDLSTSNSRIALSGLTCKNLEMATSNARLELIRVEAKQSMRGKTSNSRIQAQQVLSGGDLALSTSNGHLTASDVRARKELRLTTSNGGLEVNGCDAASVTLTTSNASVVGAVSGRQQDWAIESATSNGSNSLPKRQPGEKRLSVHTSNGSIRLGFTG